MDKEIKLKYLHSPHLIQANYQEDDLCRAPGRW